MAEVIFFEKPGCQGNARQKRVLSEAGHTVIPRNLLAEPWTPETLRPFFGDRPVAIWFNPNAPKVTSGEIDPASYDEAAALALLAAEPMLIRRPLLESGGRRESGFDPDLIDAWIGLAVRPAEDPGKCHRDTTCATP